MPPVSRAIVFSFLIQWSACGGFPRTPGCVNMVTADSKWLFRWTTPVYRLPIESRGDWYQTGYGTQVTIT